MVEIEIKPLEQLPATEDNGTPSPFALEANTYSNISYEDFFNNHMMKNIPCIIKNVGTDWESSKKWVKDGKIDFDYLTNEYGNSTVHVTDCDKIKFDSQPRAEMKFSDYINYWKNTTRDKILYLKDWHLQINYPEDTIYTVPELFASDWLNEYANDKQLDDFMFVYMGPTGSWTPMHVDVYNSFSWSVNVAGKKKWFLFPPGEENKLRDKFDNVVLRFDPEKFKDKQVVYYEIIQETGDAIFVPSTWYHQVENTMDTISINHNWVNGHNIKHAWNSLVIALDKVVKEIDELKDDPDFTNVCQNMLKHLHGMDCEGFIKLITHIGGKRLRQLEGASNIGFSNYALGKNHCMFDLRCLRDVIIMITQHSGYINNEYPVFENFHVLQDCLAYIF